MKDGVILKMRFVEDLMAVLRLHYGERETTTGDLAEVLNFAGPIVNFWQDMPTKVLSQKAADAEYESGLHAAFGAAWAKSQDRVADAMGAAPDAVVG